MILITGTARIKPGMREQMLAAAKPMIEASRQEEGCRAYRYGFDALDPDVMTFHEEWESEEAFAAHFQTPHMAEFLQASREFAAGRPEMTKWDNAVEGTFG